MTKWNRRDFMSRSLVAGATLGFELPAAHSLSEENGPCCHPERREGSAFLIDEQNISKSERTEAAIDFRYSPLRYQSTFCFPDDPAKSLVDSVGSLLYDFPPDHLAAIHQFGTIVSFSLAGMQPQPQRIRQWLEAPGVPIIHTHVEQPTAVFELITFATNRDGEGRVDNVLLEIRPRQQTMYASPLISISSCKKFDLAQKDGLITKVLRDGVSYMYCIPQQQSYGWIVWRPDNGSYHLTLEAGNYSGPRPLRYFFRLPQNAAPEDKLATDVSPDDLLTEARTWWKQWKSFGGPVNWSIPGREGEFLIACTRNIQQARERKDGHLVFQVGPTVYRGLWIVDGNFLLEAARYLGFDKEADQGLESEWRQQLPTGQIVAAGGGEHWKDTAIAIFTLVRACELKQDFAMLRALAPEVGKAINFLIHLRDSARQGNSLNGKYGLLAPGFPDGGLGGVRSEFTNTAWTLAGLRAVSSANEHLQLPELSKAAPFYRELRSAFRTAAQREMVRHPDGFNYLPMLLHEDPALHDPDPLKRPRPQSAQWALSHAIFPGEVFDKNDPIVCGHIALMQSCTREDVPTETGWLWQDAVWTYNAAFVAEVYLWAGLQQWANRTFAGFLNHASPLYAWREEQPLRTALYGEYWGDMPHNWASAECVRYLRHMLVLEDGQNLRLLAGMTASVLESRQPFSLTQTPTRFGRISLTFEPEGRNGWRMAFAREGANTPSTVELPAGLGAAQAKVEGAASHLDKGKLLIDPASRSWTVRWL